MRIGLFTQHFLEPTHHAIAMVIGGLTEYRFRVFAKQFCDDKYFLLANVDERREICDVFPAALDLDGCSVIQAIYDGSTAIRAGFAAREARLPFVLSFHGGFDTHVKIFSDGFRSATRDLVNRDDAVTVVCESDVKRLESIGVDRSLSVVPVPVD